MSKSDDFIKKYLGDTTSNGQKNTAQQSNKTAGSSAADTFINKYNPTVNESYINSFLSDWNSYANKQKTTYDGLNWKSATSYKSDEDGNDLMRRAGVIKSYLQQNKDRIGEDSYKSLVSQLDDIEGYHSEFAKAFSDAKDYFSQWETEDDYNKYVAYQKDYEEKSNYDIDAGRKEIESLEAELQKLKKSNPTPSAYLTGNTTVNGRPYAAGMQAQNEVTPTDSKISELEKLISQKKQYLNQAKHIQEGITLSGVVDSADFDEYSGYVSTKSDSKWDKLIGKEYDETYEYINNQNGIRDEIKQKHRSYSSDNPFDDGESRFEENGYDHMTENEIAIYNYYYAKEGKEAAEKYLNNIQETLNQRKATGMFEDMEGKTAQELVFGIAAGFDQFKSGMKNLINTEDDYIAQTAYQIASGMVREDLADNGAKLPEWMGGASLGQVAYDTITTSANMAPSILVGSVLGSGFGSAMMGLSAAGGAYQQALNEGYDKDQARGYSILVGASEVVMEKALGGISAFGGNALGKTLTKNVANADTALKMIAKRLGGSMISEFSEEYLQEVLDPVFRNIMLNTDEEVKLISAEAIYSGILGALTAGIMEGPTTIYGEVNNQITGKKLQAADISAARLVEIGKTFSADSVAYELAGKVDENTGAYTLGRLFNEIGATLTDQNVSDITNALVEKGWGENTAKENAKVLAYVVEGGQLTSRDAAIIEANTALAEVARTVLVDANSTVNQRTKGYQEALMALAKEKASPKTAQAKAAEAGKENAPVSDKVDAQKENGSEDSSEVDTSPSQVSSITSIKNRTATIKLEDGSEVSVKDADLSPEDGVRIETIAKIDGITATDANAILGTLRVSTGTSAQMDSLGASEAYRYGRYGLSKEYMAEHGVFVGSLTDAQRDTIYEIGQRARQQQAATKQTEIEKSVQEAKAALANEPAEVSESRSYRATLEDGVSALSLNESQKASYKLADQIAEAAKVNIRVYVGKTGEHGYYNPKTDEIYLNLNATNKSRKSMMAFTLGHELVHRAKKGSPAKYEAFANFLVEQYGKQGSSVDAMIAEELAAAKEFGIEMSYDKAFEEVVCNACQRMLLDTDAGQKLAAFGAQNKQNKSFLDDVKRWITEFMDKLRSIFAGVDPDSMAAKEFAKFDESVKQILADMYVDMTIDAGENLSTIQNAFGKGTEVHANESGEFTMANSEDGSKKVFNLVTWNNGGRETLEATLLREGYTEDEVKAALTIMDEKQRLVESIANEVDGNGRLAFPEQGRINEATLTTDLKDGHSVLSALVSNGDYPVNIDLLMVCKKRKAYQRVINRLCETGMIQQATVDALAIAEINKILGKYGFETACLGCFVESRRLRIQEWAQTIVKEWNSEVKKRNPNAKAFGFGKGEATLTPDEVMKIIGELESGGPKNEKGNLNLGQGSAVKRMGVLLDKVPSLQRTLSIEDLVTPDGLTSLRSFDSNLFSMVKSRYGSNSPKFVQEFNPYNHELAKYGKVPTQYESLREYLYAIGGARMQSFSDFIIENWFDYCQIVADLAARKLPMHTYTKEIALAKLFGLTGIKINMSLIPDVDRSLGKEFAGLTRNANGELELIWADKDRFKATGGKSYMQSINFADAIALQNDPRYSANVGTIAVGISDKHIEVMLDDARIRMIIPYHSSGMNPIFADLMGTSYYKDYTNFQNTTIKQIYNSKGQKVDLKLDKTQVGNLTGGFQFNEVLQDLGDARAAAEAYKEWCADASKHTITIKGETYTAELTPKFNDFSGHQNYYKLLEDFNTYDCISEEAARQGDVQQIYPENFDEILKAELSAQERHRQKQEANQAFDKAMGEIESYLKNHSKANTVYYANQHGIKLGAKDKKLNAAEKEKLKNLQAEGASFSLPRVDSDGNQLSEEQQEFFKDSKARDKKGNLLRLYHGSNYQVTKFNPMFSDDKTSLFMTDKYDVAASYSRKYRELNPYEYIDENSTETELVEAANKFVFGKYNLKAISKADISAASDRVIPKLPSIIEKLNSISDQLNNSQVKNTFGARGHGRNMYVAMETLGSNPTGKEYEKLLSKTIGNSPWLNMVADNLESFLAYDSFEFVHADIETVVEEIRELRADVELLNARDSGDRAIFRYEDNLGRESYISETMLRKEINWATSGGILPVYANITNPYVVDAKGRRWNNIATPEEMRSFHDFDTVKTRTVAAYAKANGYDGVIFKGLVDMGGDSVQKSQRSTVVIAFDGTQMKSTMNKKPTSDPDIRYSLPRAEAIKPSNEQIESNIQTVAGMKSVHDIDASKLEKSGKKLVDIFEEHFESWGHNIYSDIFGDIAVKNSSIRSDLRHGFTPVKIASIEAIPTVIKSGKIVGWIEKNNGTLFRIVVAAPITIGETPYIMGVMLQRDDKYQRLYLHDVVIEKEAFDFSQDDLVSTGSSESENLYMTSILQKVLDVKQQAALNRDYKLPVGEDTSPRALLANAFDTVITNPIEKNKLQEYKKNVAMLNEEEAKLRDLREQIKELSFAKGPKDTKKIRSLQFEANQAANRINTLDKMLLRFEASAPLQNVLNREKELAYKRADKKRKDDLAAYRERAAKTQRELLDRWQESRKRGIEGRQKTAMRHKIKDVVNELNQYLLKGTKDRHVPIGLQKAVAEALNAVNMDTVGAEERIAKLQADLMKAKSPDEIQEISKKIDNIREMGDRLDEKLKRLKTAYDEFINSDDPLIANSHDDAVSAHMMKLIVRVGDTPLREMTLDQLQDVYDVYKVVLATIRNANKSFKDNKNREISTRANQVMAEIDDLGVKRGKRPVFMSWIEKFGWDGLKPVYAMEHIGSQGLIDAYNNVRAGEDTWANDIVEAREYYLEKFRKYKYDSWDFEKKHKFTSTTEMNFELTLDQIMSLYAYSKRDQAADHLKYGGIVFDPKTEVVEKTKSGIKVKYNVANATAYNISEETLADIIGTLTEDQKGFVDEMQTYLSDVMGAKGNEVSLAMYDVKLFREKHYFPLKSAHQYMAKAKEQAQGDVKIKNSGFSKETKPHAKNPIVLSSFMDVWSSHVNEMSMYHAFVLPMEDFYRIYNYTTPSKDETLPTEGVNPSIENAYGIAATEYIEQMLKDLNGGARSDSRTGFINKMMGLFKKGAVFASLSVVVQQPSAIARAAAIVDTKYFIGPKVDQKRHKALWKEVKQYAPVAIIKEMGYFDTNMGKSTQDFIMGQEYSGFSEKMKALVADSNYRDEVLSKAPALADEIAWCGIWEAVKRETKDKNPGMDVTSEEFLKTVGERFTEVIVKTQVYDSVLSRSALMRSKDTGLKMATAFMAEPTTSINMVADALLKGKRGNRKYCRTAIGAVVASQILNSILVSFVYAGRDDDEEETYAEKYIGTLTGEVLDSLNPAGYIPFIKDIVSIVQGYDVERSDMAVVSDLWKAWQNLSKDDVSVYRKVEGFAGSIAQIFGLPVKNIMRDARGIYQTVMSFMNSQEKTTKAGIGYAIKGAITGNTATNKEQLYEARMAGDKEHASRVEARYGDTDSADAAVRAAIKDSFMADEIDEATALKQMVLYAGMDAIEAHWLMDAWKYRKNVGSEEGYSKYGRFYDAVRTGKNLKAVVKEYTDNGIKPSTLSSQITEEFKPEYVKLSASQRASMKGYLANAYALCGMDREAAMENIAVWDWEAQGYDGATAAAVRNYNEYCAADNVPKDIYLYIRKLSSNTDNDVDENGKSINYSAMKKIMAEIDAQRLTAAQKTAIARSLGWTEKNIQKYKTW